MDKEFVDILMNHTLSTYPYKINILWYDLYSVSNLILLLETPINNLRNQKADEQEKVELYENMAIHITIFITIMAIAAILTAQMQIRLQERDDDERFSHLRAEILKDESIFQKRKDRISYFILIIAVIISMASLALIII
jgi:Na+/H+ antiporter NhaC